ncbi:helix-turn-helix transcriptional regulator, partial [Peribacillus simplex]
KKWRKLRKLTQAQLSTGVCNQSEISRLESGEFFPSIEVLHLISNKLEVPLTYFIEVLIHGNIHEEKEAKELINTLLLKKEYSEIYRITDDIIRQKAVIHPELQKFLLWQYYVSAYNIGRISHSYCVTELFNLLRTRTKGIDIFLDLHIKNSLANLLAEAHYHSKSIKLYKDILNEEISTDEVQKLKVKVLFNYGKLLKIQKNHKDALSITNRGIELSCKLSDMSLIGQLHYQKGIVMEELNYEFQEVSKVFKKAYFIFELLGLQLYVDIIKEKKSEYLL